MKITQLGEAKHQSPLNRTISDTLRVPEYIISEMGNEIHAQRYFELAGPRKKLYFDPKKTRAGIVTCGGLCPGLNNVIRSIFHELYHAYGVKEIYGFRGGYIGLDPDTANKPLLLTADFVDDIHNEGGTVLGTSRGPVDIVRAVDNLVEMQINILFIIGGDGTQRGGNEIFQEATRRGHDLSVVGIPKTVDNDVPFVAKTFGYNTAVEEAARMLDRAHIEARSVENGISLVKLMGRHAGFIAAGATVASQDVNFVLIPEVPFKLEGENGFFEALKKRMLNRKHALIVVAEGAGQDLIDAANVGKDASGNALLHDIGYYLKDEIVSYFRKEKIPVVMRYIDPGYLIRSSPADAEDAILCDIYARNAVHAAMAGKTGLVIGLMHDKFIHVPIELLTTNKKSMDVNGLVWSSTLAATGQPEVFY